MTRALATSWLLASALSAAAGYVPGKPAITETTPAAKSARATALPADALRAIRLVPLGTAASARLAHEANTLEKRVRIGARREIALESEAGTQALAPDWVAMPAGGWRMRVSVHSPGAAALRLGIDLRALPSGTTLTASGSAPIAVAPEPVTGENALAAARAQGLYWSPVTEGDTQQLDIVLPPGSDPAQARVTALEVSHLAVAATSRFKATSGVGASQACHEDVACVAPSNAALAQAARSVAKLVFTENGSTYMCTGTLISDGDAASQVPYLYTAAHCIGTQAAAATLNTFWFFEAPACNTKSANDYRQLAGGATLLLADAASDAALLRLSDRAPDGAWFSGWDAGTLAEGTPLVALHHPAGDLKKVAIGKALSATPTSGGSSYATTAWITGSTEGGSSGSGIFSLAGNQYVLRGGLKGGSASCTTSGRLEDPSNRDYYSRLDLVGGVLRTWLSAAVSPLEDYTDMWWNPEESGWGLSIVQHPSNRAFVIWYSYDRDGSPAWFTMPDPRWASAFALEGTLYRTTGPAYDQPHASAPVAVATAGQGRIEFGHSGTATATFVVDGRTVVKSVRRFGF